MNSHQILDMTKLNFLTTDLVAWTRSAFDGKNTCMPLLMHGYGLRLARQSSEYFKVMNSVDTILADGVAVKVIAKLSGVNIQRNTGSDLFEVVMSHTNSVQGTVFFLGGTPEILRELCINVGSNFPKVKMTGTYAPPFSNVFQKAENQKIISLIDAAKPDVVWVGLGAPKQEIWAIEHLKYCKNVKIIAGIGAVFDFYSGNISRAPNWVRSIGLEWFYRGVAAPRQLWRRNISSMPIFVLILLENWRLAIRRVFQRYGF